jgi:hypothetical protein
LPDTSASSPIQKADDGAVHRVVLSIPSREGDVQRAADEAEDAIRRIACQKNPLVLDESAELGDGAQPGARRFRALREPALLQNAQSGMQIGAGLAHAPGLHQLATRDCIT